MRKNEKLNIIDRAIKNIELCRCYFSYDENYFYYYPHVVNDKFILGQEEDDFILDGYAIRKISHLTKVEIKDDKCNDINKLNGLTLELKNPDIDISSWESIFLSLKQLDTFVIIQDERNGNYSIGIIEKVLKNKIYFLEFDADGIWSDDKLEIPYSSITSVKWNTRYDTVWKAYFSNNTLKSTLSDF